MTDYIERQAAIDGADAIIARDTSGNNDVVKAMTAWKSYVEALPPAEPRLSRCRDCMNNRGKFCSVANHYVGENDDCISTFGAKRRTK